MQPRRWPAQAGRGASFDNLVRAGEEGLRYGQAERLGGLQVDDQLEIGGLFDRQFSRVGTFEDLGNINRSLDVSANDAWRIADKAACDDKLAPTIHDGNGILRCERHHAVLIE